MSAETTGDTAALEEQLRSRDEEIARLRDEIVARDEELGQLNARLKSNEFVLREKIEKLQTLIDVGRQLNSRTDLQSLLESLMSLATRVMKARDSSLLLMDEESNELVFSVALGDKSDRIQQFRVKVGQGIAGEVAASGKPVMVDDVHADNRWDASFDAKTGFETKSIMAVPIKLGDEVIGVIEVLNAGFSGSLTDEDLEVFEAFSAHAAVAIENARIYKVLHTSVAQISDVVGAGAIMTDWSGDLQLITDRAKSALGLAEDEEVTSRTLRKLSATPNIGRMIDDVLESGEAVTESVKVDGGGTVEVHSAPVVDVLRRRLGVVTVIQPQDDA